MAAGRAGSGGAEDLAKLGKRTTMPATIRPARERANMERIPPADGGGVQARVEGIAGKAQSHKRKTATNAAGLPLEALLHCRKRPPRRSGPARRPAPTGVSFSVVEQELVAVEQRPE